MRTNNFFTRAASAALLLALGCGPGSDGETKGQTDSATTGDSAGSSDGSTGAGQCPPPLELEATLAEQDYPAVAAELYCSVGASCGCPNYADDCYARVLDELEAEAAAAESLGLTWDGACAARRLLSAYESSCLFDGVPDACFTDEPPEACSEYHGSKREGEACTATSGASDCAQGLLCDFFLDTCQPPPTPDSIPVVGEGEPCYVDFETVGLCDLEQSLSCDVLGTGLCVVGDDIGEPCTNPSTCVFGAWCDGSLEPDTCVAWAEAGESCSGPLECAASLSCFAGQCADFFCFNIEV